MKNICLNIVLVFIGISTFSQSGDSISKVCGVRVIIVDFISGKKLDSIKIQLKGVLTDIIYCDSLINAGEFEIYTKCSNDSLGFKLDISKEGYYDSGVSLKKESEFGVKVIKIKLKSKDDFDLCSISPIHNPIYYNSLQFELDSINTLKLEVVLKFLLENPNKFLSITSYSDCQESGNELLSKKRSEVIKMFLIKKNISPNRIKTIFHGSKRPVNLCDCKSNSKDCGKYEYAVNRRSEFRIYHDKINIDEN